MRTHAIFTHPTIQPLRKLQPPGTIWRTVCGAQRLHSLANTARLIIRPPTRRAGPRAGRRLKSHLSLRLYQRKIPTELSGELGELHLTSRPGRPAYTPTDSERYTSAYTKVYESVCPVGVGVHCDALPAGSPAASGCETPPKRLGVKTRGAPSPGYRASRHHETTLGIRRGAVRQARFPNFWACLAMRTHAIFTHPTIQPLRKLQPPGTIWRTACGAQRLLREPA